MFFRSVFGRALGPNFGDVVSLLGSVLGTILGTFGVPFLHRFSEGFWDSPKVKAGLEWKVIPGLLGVQ